MAKFSGVLKNYAEKAKERDAFWIERTKLQFATSLEKQRRNAGMTYAAVAEKLGTSAAYVTKVFRGDSNVTIESMVKLAHATGGRVEVRVVDAALADAHWSVASLVSKPGAYRYSANSETAAMLSAALAAPAANYGRFRDEQVLVA